MKKLGFVKATLLGLAVACGPIASTAIAENVTVVRKGANRDLSVPMNRAVVVESDVPFAELSIANPTIADFSTLSDRTIYVLGKAPGRTTLTLLDANGRLITNVEVRVAADISEFKERLGKSCQAKRSRSARPTTASCCQAAYPAPRAWIALCRWHKRYAPERVSNLMVVSGNQQVMLKVRFAEMQRSVSKALSTSLRVDGRNGTGRRFGRQTTCHTAGASSTRSVCNSSGQTNNAHPSHWVSMSVPSRLVFFWKPLKQRGLFARWPNRT